MVKSQEKRLGGVELTMVEVRSDIGYIKRDLTEIKNKIDTFIDCAPEKFADKTKVREMRVEVENLKKTVRSLELKWAYATGIAIVLVSAIQILLKVSGVF